jgi:hypothetical protein
MKFKYISFAAVASEYPDLSFSPEIHGVQVKIRDQPSRSANFSDHAFFWQVFVHTLLATNATLLGQVDVSWVTQLTADRLDIFSKVWI